MYYEYSTTSTSLLLLLIFVQPDNFP